MKTKLYLLIGAVAVTLGMSVNIAHGQKSGYGTQKSSTAMQGGKKADDNQGRKPGASLGGGKYVAIIVTPEEAAKKYPPPAGKSYPNGMDAQMANDIGSAQHSGFIKSPYSSRVYDCRKIGEGTLLLDDAANKVFVRPPTR